MTRTLISIDLDWLNDQEFPIDKLIELLKYIPPETPAIMTVEHHEFLLQLRKWVESGKVQTPFQVLNIDEHHDYYNNRRTTDCGNWGYHIPREWYNRYTWVNNSLGEYDSYWRHARKWLKKHKIPHSFRRKRHRLSELKTEMVAAIFCVSPDYLSGSMYHHIYDAVEVVADHFEMTEAPQQFNFDHTNLNSPHRLQGWQVATRPRRMTSLQFEE